MLAEFKGCEISNTCEISDLRGILNIAEFKCLEILNASKILSLPCVAFGSGAVSQVFAGRRNCA
ncbi:hypothetical protein [uncultured Campylobacter sp.]|uniref:hypothetical protein n=1 Tax=uncultured Campylobacter sp. TaxID=218934 RepID=UPI0026170F7C|nr:hypothetical protein [uncultured Campylobacter sp.]